MTGFPGRAEVTFNSTGQTGAGAA